MKAQGSCLSDTSLWAGQGVGLGQSMGAAELVDHLSVAALAQRDHRVQTLSKTRARSKTFPGQKELTKLETAR